MKKQNQVISREIAIFTDAHALLEPTEVILKDIKNRGITEIYSLGDNIGLGPNPSEVVDLLNEYQVVTIQGNYESTLDFGVEPFLSYMSQEKINQMEWTESKLSKEQKEKLILSPHFLNLQMANKKIALCHFANDVRHDFLIHSSLGYRYSLDMGRPGYEQFYYTNSTNQLFDIAGYLGVDARSFPDLFDRDIVLEKIREHIKLNKDKISPSKRGYISYCEDPLFYRDGHLLTIQDYDMVIQGHVHFSSKESDGKTSIYTVRAAGMGYDIGEAIDQATYMILEEKNGGIEAQMISVPFDREKMEHSINHCELVNSDIKRYTMTK